MSGKTNIEWTEISWNPTTGCNKVSDGCKYCYAEKWAYMQQKRGIDQYTEGFKFRLAKERLLAPFQWKTRKIVFVNSMSDIFHENMPIEYLTEVFQVMNSTPQHTYQLLTKRIERVNKITNLLQWTDNIWLGVSVENNKNKSRIDLLKNTAAKNKFISFEPLLEEILNVNLQGIDWVIVGGESGGKARPIKLQWILPILKICKERAIPFFFKQWGKRAFNPDYLDPTLNKINHNYSRGGCMLNGKLYRETPINNELAN